MILTIKKEVKLKDALKKHSQLKTYLITLTPKFKKLSNPLLLNTLAKNVTMEEVGQIAGFSTCEFLEKINHFLGYADEFKAYHDCNHESLASVSSDSRLIPPEKPEWLQNAMVVMTEDLRQRSDFFFSDLIKKFVSMKKHETFAIINDFDPLPLKKEAIKYGLEYYTEPYAENAYKITFYKVKELSRIENKSYEFSKDEYIDLNAMFEDPIYFVFAFAKQATLGSTLTVIHDEAYFALEKVLLRKGFSVETSRTKDGRFKSVFHKEHDPPNDRPSIIIQSATPIFYPALLRLLQSDRLLDTLDISIMRVWYETEKHLKWVNNGYADVSLSAVMVAAKFASNNLGVKLLSIDVWDNFYLLTRGYKANSFHDVKGHTIVMPLFEKAPPASITRYLIQKSGLDPKDFKFEFGTGVSKMGRPNNIEQGFKEGWLDTVLLRLPEASYTIHGVDDAFLLSYGELWRKFHPKSRGLPNAGVLMKEDFLTKHPTESTVFVEELVKAINWIKQYPSDAATLSADIMNRSKEDIQDFILKVNLTHVPVQEALTELKQYYQLLIDAKTMYLRSSLDETLKNLIPEYA